ncbi:Myc-type, basic helix-loop-helix (bHLH) domain [Dillenia turbinata]|uniref:Myc-type, basic helix-loop-helix (BHLH) domain n=1 Tax=Dillenia turbinata TaxID=194707 RepID=A0AAN8W2L4_9MAGN
MEPSQNHFGLECSSNAGIPIEEPEWTKLSVGDSSISSGSTVKKPKSTAASKSHSEAERRRRQRINTHLSTLRTLLPNTIKTDKASLLAEVVQHVRELKKRAAEVAMNQNEGRCGRSSTESCSDWPFLLPGETDEVIIEYLHSDQTTKKRVKATVCSEDRPSLNRELTRAIQMTHARAVRAEMAVVGGRVKCVVLMEFGGEEAEILTLRRAMKAVVENRRSCWVGSMLDHKRARLCG